MTTATHQIVTHVTHPSHARRHAASVGTGFEKYPRQEGPHSLDGAIGELARRQHGVVSWMQLRGLGVPRHVVDARVQAERWHRLHRGVYAVGHLALTWRSHLIAAVYACGPGALASHRAAGALHGLLRSQRIEVTTGRSAKPKPGITVHRTRLIHPEDRVVVAAVPATSVARTLVDLADVLTEERLTDAVRQAEILRVFDLEAVQRACAPGRRGRHRLARVLATYQPEPHLIRSEAESKLKQLIEAHSLPQPQFNVNLHGYEVDAYWPEQRLVLEVDGAATHHTRHAFHIDRRRDRALAAHGIQSLRVTAPDLGTGLMDQLRAILRRR
jgi:very-short-patch-repair endonuclease